VERLRLDGQLLERFELEWLELVGQFLERQLVERIVLVGKLLEWLELEWFELERKQLVGRIMARSDVGPMSNQSGHKWLGASWG
jgi:hypothetical protein